MSEANVTIYVFNDPACEAACNATLAAFRAKGCALDVRHTNIDVLRDLMGQGFTVLPVVRLAREGESWQGHQPERITAYEPRLTEFRWDTRRCSKRGFGR